MATFGHQDMFTQQSCLDAKFSTPFTAFLLDMSITDLPDSAVKAVRSPMNAQHLHIACMNEWGALVAPMQRMLFRPL